MIVNASAKRLIRWSKGKPNAANSVSFQPAPRPRTRRPPLISSTVAACLASIAGAWNAVAATSGPSVTRDVTAARAASSVHASHGPAGAVVAGPAVEEVVAGPDGIEAELLGAQRHRPQVRPAGLPLDLGELDADLERATGHRGPPGRIVGDLPARSAASGCGGAGATSAAAATHQAASSLMSLRAALTDDSARRAADAGGRSAPSLAATPGDSIGNRASPRSARPAMPARRAPFAECRGGDIDEGSPRAAGAAARPGAGGGAALPSRAVRPYRSRRAAHHRPARRPRRTTAADRRARPGQAQRGSHPDVDRARARRQPSAHRTSRPHATRRARSAGPRLPRPAQALRRADRRRRRRLRDRRRRDLRPARPQRRRQDHHDLDDLRPAPARRRRGHRRPAGRSTSGRPTPRPPSATCPRTWPSTRTSPRARTSRFFGRLQRLGGKELERRVDEVLALIGLADRAKRPHRQLLRAA